MLNINDKDFVNVRPGHIFHLEMFTITNLKSVYKAVEKLHGQNNFELVLLVHLMFK